MNRHCHLGATTYIDIEDVGEVRVDWTFSDYVPAQISGPVEACYPSEGGELIDVAVTLPNGMPVKRSEEWLMDRLGAAEFERQEELAFCEARADERL